MINIRTTPCLLPRQTTGPIATIRRVRQIKPIRALALAKRRRAVPITYLLRFRAAFVFPSRQALGSAPPLVSIGFRGGVLTGAVARIALAEGCGTNPIAGWDCADLVGGEV